MFYKEHTKYIWKHVIEIKITECSLCLENRSRYILYFVRWRFHRIRSSTLAIKGRFPEFAHQPCIFKIMHNVSSLVRIPRVFTSYINSISSFHTSLSQSHRLTDTITSPKLIDTWPFRVILFLIVVLFGLVSVSQVWLVVWHGYELVFRLSIIFCFASLPFYIYIQLF